MNPQQNNDELEEIKQILLKYRKSCFELASSGQHDTISFAQTIKHREEKRIIEARIDEVQISLEAGRKHKDETWYKSLVYTGGSLAKRLKKLQKQLTNLNKSSNEKGDS